jgi:hypothetical protein
MKGLSGYYLKLPYFEDLLCQLITEQQNNFSVAQLEMLLWALSRRQSSECHYPERVLEAATAIMTQTIANAYQLKPRGVAFAVEAISSLPSATEEHFM